MPTTAASGAVPSGPASPPASPPPPRRHLPRSPSANAGAVDEPGPARLRTGAGFDVLGLRCRRRQANEAQRQSGKQRQPSAVA